MNVLVLLVASTLFMEFLDGTIIVTALPAMADSFHTEAVTLHVGITAYLLTVAVFILPGGWAAERFGARTVFTAAIATFTVGSALCGLANSTAGFVAARLVQGVGGAMMVPVGRLVVLRTTAKPDLMRAIALLTWPALSAPLLGPPLGGVIAQHASWRWIFLINLPVGLIGMLLALRLVPTLAASVRRPFDWLGFALGALMLIGLLRGLDLLAAGDASWLAIALTWGAAFAAAAPLWWHIGHHNHPLLDPAPLLVATFRSVFINGTAMRLLISAVPFVLPLMFQLGFGLDPFHAGLLMIALFAGNLGIKPLTSPILRRLGFRTVLIGNALLQALTMLGFAIVNPATPEGVLLALLVVSGASRSLQFTALSTLAFADVPQPAMSSANTLFSVTFQLGIGLGVAIGAVTLRGIGRLLGDATASSLPVFHGTFVVLASLMALTAIAALELARDAGAVVSGHRIAAR